MYFSLWTGNQEFGYGSTVSIGLLFEWLVLKDRQNLCLESKEDNFSSHGHPTDRCRPVVDSKIYASMTLLLEIILIGIIQSSSRGPESRQSLHWRTVKWKLPDCNKNVENTIISPQHWKQSIGFLPIGYTIFTNCFRLQIFRRKIPPGSSAWLT